MSVSDYDGAMNGLRCDDSMVLLQKHQAQSPDNIYIINLTSLVNPSLSPPAQTSLSLSVL